MAHIADAKSEYAKLGFQLLLLPALHLHTDAVERRSSNVLTGSAYVYVYHRSLEICMT